MNGTRAGVAAVVAVLLIACGGGGGPAPSGAQTILRIAPESATVSCGSPAAASVYLDDLQSRDGAASGIAGFQFVLHYDPAVVRIARTADIALNPALTEDGAGSGRSFFLTGDIDDAGGRATLGASSSLPGGTARDAAGPDPVAIGEALLLATVRFEPVAAGTTTLSLAAAPGTDDAPQLLDPAGVAYEPVELEDARLTVEGDCVTETVEQPQVTPGGVVDCAQEWTAYTDQQDRFSVCYPSDFATTLTESSINIHALDAQADGLVSIAVSWQATSGYGSGVPNADTCRSATGSVPDPVSSTFAELTIRGRPVAACLSIGRENGSLHGAIALAAGGSGREGYVGFVMDYRGSDLSIVPETGQAVLQTLVVNVR